jgi:hypothetical protein
MAVRDEVMVERWLWRARCAVCPAAPLNALGSGLLAVLAGPLCCSCCVFPFFLSFTFSLGLVLLERPQASFIVLDGHPISNPSLPLPLHLLVLRRSAPAAAHLRLGVCRCHPSDDVRHAVRDCRSQNDQVGQRHCGHQRASVLGRFLRSEWHLGLAVQRQHEQLEHPLDTTSRLQYVDPRTAFCVWQNLK